MSLRNVYMESLILLLSYISVYAVLDSTSLPVILFIADNDESVNMNMTDCSDVSPYNDLLVHNSRPTRYIIHFKIYSYLFTFHATTRIIIVVENPTRDISLHVSGLLIKDPVHLTSVYSETEKYKLTGYRYCKQPQILNLQFNKIIVPGIYNLTIHTDIRQYPPKGVIVYYYKGDEIDDDENMWLAITELNMARRVFPCWDEPGLKAIFNISITHSTYCTPFSNMPILFTNYYNTDAHTTYFNDTPLISPLNVFIVVLKHNKKFKTRDMSGNDLIWYISQRQMLEYAMNTIAMDDFLLTTITHLTVVLPKRNHIFFPNNVIKTMGSIGLMIYSEKDVLYNRDFDFPGQKVYISQVISYQMVRQLFTAVVTQSRWADQWIGESLSKLYCHYMMGKIFGATVAKAEHLPLIQLYAIQILQTTLHYETNFGMTPLSEYNIQIADEIDILGSRWYYNKGFALLRMIEHMITRDKFQLAVETYLDKFMFYSATPYNFWITIQRVLDNKQNEKFKIKEMMDTWLTQRHYPVVQVFQDRGYNTMMLNITHSVSMTKSTWMVPITYILYHSMGAIINDIWITSSDIVTINLPIEENINFVIFNVNHNGECIYTM
ncbi:glutamyl aminopeptidase-like [Harpegnathos saltator]|uniref:glutamyl aminopeptidase-like n=1 Tax=Harpegnathos saltator TaxID=610380 RepID=UPI000DBECF6D|nr:glutamyl aminopeptidase-like [Harpegnathos saltator]